MKKIRSLAPNAKGKGKLEGVLVVETSFESTPTANMQRGIARSIVRSRGTHGCGVGGGTSDRLMDGGRIVATGYAVADK